MRKVLAAAVLAGLATPLAGAHAAILNPKCPDGYVGVVVDNHNACTNAISQCPPGYTGAGVAGRNVCVSVAQIKIDQ